MKEIAKNIYPAFFLIAVTILLVAGCSVLPVLSVAAEANEVPLAETIVEEAMSMAEIEEHLSQDGIEYYAYMDIRTAPSKLVPVILEARSRIIYGEGASWVADDIDGYIKDEDGNILEVVPHFHEVFPEDWEIPIRK